MTRRLSYRGRQASVTKASLAWWTPGGRPRVAVRTPRRRTSAETRARLLAGSEDAPLVQRTRLSLSSPFILTHLSFLSFTQCSLSRGSEQTSRMKRWLKSYSRCSLKTLQQLFSTWSRFRRLSRLVHQFRTIRTLPRLVWLLSITTWRSGNRAGECARTRTRCAYSLIILTRIRIGPTPGKWRSQPRSTWRQTRSQSGIGISAKSLVCPLSAAEKIVESVLNKRTKLFMQS